MKYLAYMNILFGDNQVQNCCNCKDKSQELKLNDYDYPSRKDRIRIGGGGLLVYFKSSGIKYERKNNLESSLNS